MTDLENYNNLAWWWVLHNHTLVHLPQLEPIDWIFPDLRPNAREFCPWHRFPLPTPATHSTNTQRSVDDSNQMLCAEVSIHLHPCTTTGSWVLATLLTLSIHPDCSQWRWREQIWWHSFLITEKKLKLIINIVWITCNSNITHTITYGTASKNFFTRLFEHISVRSRFPWPSHSTCVNFPMSLSWIHIRMFDGLMTMAASR